MSKMNLQDTLSNNEQKLDVSKKIKIYLCGVTVYDESHIGHARTIIVFDVLRKYLESKKIEVEFIQNFTDVDDKIINRATTENVSAEEISNKYIKNYLVLGSSDKSEYLIGYFTKFGDGASDLTPISSLYKLQVREIAKYLKIPENIISKRSSPHLWKNHEA